MFGALYTGVGIRLHQQVDLLFPDFIPDAVEVHRRAQGTYLQTQDTLVEGTGSIQV
jgi:hypothetical protein